MNIHTRDDEGFGSLDPLVMVSRSKITIGNQLQHTCPKVLGALNTLFVQERAVIDVRHIVRNARDPVSALAINTRLALKVVRTWLKTSAQDVRQVI